jgi:hypothetical protein
MSKWALKCSNCGTPNEVPNKAVTEKCGIVYFQGRCINCKNELNGEQEYWRWLGLEEGPPAEENG